MNFTVKWAVGVHVRGWCTYAGMGHEPRMSLHSIIFNAIVLAAMFAAMERVLSFPGHAFGVSHKKGVRMRAMILAAGLGTRLRPLTLVRPKVLVPVAGVPVLDFWVEQLHLAGFEAIAVNAFHLGKELAAEIGSRNWPIPVEVRIEPVLLGTGGGIANVVDFFEGAPFVVVNGDIVCRVQWEAILDRYRNSEGSVCLLLHDCPKFNNVAVDEDGFILGFGKEAFEMKAAGRNVRLQAFSGIHLMVPEIFADLRPGEPADILTIYRKLIRAGKPPRALHSPGIFWREMGAMESYRDLHAEISRFDEDFLPPLPTGRRVWIHEKAHVAPGVILRGYVSIGAESVVMKGTELEDVIIWDRATIGAGSSLTDCVVGDGATVMGVHRREVIVSPVGIPDEWENRTEDVRWS